MLLFLNTFGTEILAAFSLPLAAAAAASAPAIARGHHDCKPQPSPAAMTTLPQAAGAVPQGSTPSAARVTVHGTGARIWSGRGSGGLEESPSPVTAVAAARGSGTATKLIDVDTRATGKQRGEEEGKGERDEEREYDRASSYVAFLMTMEHLSGMILLLSAARTFLSAANVSVQRGHLMLWAVFAPKFIFDATMQAVSGAAAVAVWAVVATSLRYAYSSSPPRTRRRGRWLKRRDLRMSEDSGSGSDSGIIGHGRQDSLGRSRARSAGELAPSMRLRKI